jgi:hypothetical protein
MKLGMTGNREGISLAATERFRKFLDENNITEAHHGDCIGADQEFHNIVVSKGIKVIIHPPKLCSHRAYCKSANVLEGEDYMIRNHNIVDSCDTLVAFTRDNKEIRRSGTWSTIRYAKKIQKNTIIIFPNGDVYYTQK